MNSVRLYSNGTAVISREYEFFDGEPRRIAIPVRKADLDDVVSSLAVFGDVTITEPPTYTPTNAEATTLELNPAAALRDLVLKLAGAAVEVEAGTTYKGTLVGLHPHRREVDRIVLDQHRLVLLTNQGVQQVDDFAVTAIRFSDPAIRAEVEKSLRAKIAQLKPDSSRVELTLRPDPGATGATVTYATPVAAWKIRYQLRMTPEGAELDGQAVVDNDTDDDWADTRITVITGEPITFATDLAEVRRPARSRVNVVADRTVGAVVAEPDLPPAAAALDYMQEENDGGYVGGSAYGGGVGGSSSARRLAKAVAAGPIARAVPADRDQAEQADAEARESGDFSIFTSPNPVNVAAGRSALIPLFRAAVGEPRVILLYRERDDPERPFRAVRFRNEAAHALGRGVCEVFDAGDFQGKCLLEPTKPGAEALLVHARETGVRVFKQATPPKYRRMAIRIAAGAVACQVSHRQRTTYRVRNDHPEAFPLEIEHPRTWLESTFQISSTTGTPEQADIPSGRRIRVPLPAGGTLEVVVVEERILDESFTLQNAAWLVGNIVGLPGGGGVDPSIQGCIDSQTAIDGIEAEIREQTAKSAMLVAEQDRLLKLIPNGHAPQANAWRTNLASAEAELREIQRMTLPGLKGRLKVAQDALREALVRLRYSWTELPGTEA